MVTGPAAPRNGRQRSHLMRQTLGPRQCEGQMLRGTTKGSLQYLLLRAMGTSTRGRVLTSAPRRQAPTAIARSTRAAGRSTVPNFGCGRLEVGKLERALNFSSKWNPRQAPFHSGSCWNLCSRQGLHREQLTVNTRGHDGQLVASVISPSRGWKHVGTSIGTGFI